MRGKVRKKVESCFFKADESTIIHRVSVSASVFAEATQGLLGSGPTPSTPNSAIDIAWDINLTVTRQAVDLSRFLLINDFVAQAYACRSPVISSAQQVLLGRSRISTNVRKKA